MIELLGILAVLFMIAIYFVPTMVANSKQHKNLTAIFVLNLVAGWSLIGWVGALIWALVK